MRGSKNKKNMVGYVTGNDGGKHDMVCYLSHSVFKHRNYNMKHEAHNSSYYQQDCKRVMREIRINTRRSKPV